MSKRDREFDFDTSSLKMRKEDLDDAGGSARSGRVRKKSAKVLEMEEFEQVEKTQYVTKKGKTPKTGGKTPVEEQEAVLVDKPQSLVKKIKTSKSSAASGLSTAADMTPVSSKVGKTGAGKSELGAYVAKPVQQYVPVQTSGILTSGLTSGQAINPTEMLAGILKQEYEADLPLMSDLCLPQQLLQHSPVKSEEQKSVIKYLLSSPSSGSKPSVSSNVLSKMGSSPISGIDTPVVGKKSTKKSKPQDASVVKKSKPKKLKMESLSPTLTNDMLAADKIGVGLKMKILSSSDPSSAQVTLTTQPESTPAAKHKKHKKIKQEDIQHDVMIDSADVLGLSKLDTEDPADIPVKKQKKVSKKKEKLIQDAISAAQQLPNLAALVASQTLLLSGQGQGQLAPQAVLSMPGQKPQKKKRKSASPLSMSPSSDDPNESLGKSDLSFGDDGEETHLVIAETEKKKKKAFSKKKGLAHKEKSGSANLKGDKADDKKLSKRAPTAYMLFCNSHRPEIVNENPGIEFAGISRKLGEMWQTLSSKQKLQWRRKAQRRRKKGSNLISTGKAGKEPGVATLTPTSSGQSHLSPGLKLSTLMQKAQRSSPEDTPQSPTKNFSIEPIDVAAHLKLLGESLSIIGMRLQEHKGMIAVQGSLSVLLDSLLCACGPLLCLTQQVPGMDGCSPLVHGQTLDSVAYVMPGL